MQQSPAGGSSGGGPFPSIEGKSEAPLDLPGDEEDEEEEEEEEEEDDEANLFSNDEIGNLPTLPSNSSHPVTQDIGKWVMLRRKRERDWIKPNWYASALEYFFAKLMMPFPAIGGNRGIRSAINESHYSDCLLTIDRNLWVFFRSPTKKSRSANHIFSSSLALDREKNKITRKHYWNSSTYFFPSIFLYKIRNLLSWKNIFSNDNLGIDISSKFPRYFLTSHTKILIFFLISNSILKAEYGLRCA